MKIKRKQIRRITALILSLCMVLSGLQIIPGGIKAQAAEKNKTLRLLSIGNSFSQDAQEWIYNIAKAAGYEDIIIANLYWGGCSLWQHADNAKKDFGGDGQHYEYQMHRSPQEVVTRDKSIKGALEDQEWDYVTLQQVSQDAGMENTFTNGDLDYLIEYVHKYAPQAKVGWHMTWAYQQDSTHGGFANYNRDQMTMYNAIVHCTRDIAAPKLDFVFPAGTAIQNLRTSFIGDTLTRDGYHMSYNLGRYVVGLTWIYKLCEMMGNPYPENITYTPSETDVPEYYLPAIREAVLNAVQKPYEVSQSSYKNIADLLNLDLNSYNKINWEPKENTYWHSAGDIHQELGKDEKFITSKLFTRDDLPTGTVIQVDEGFKYRPEAWESDTSKTSPRPDEVKVPTVIVTDGWWGKFNYRAFNVSKTDGSSLIGKSNEATDHFRIYLPKVLGDGGDFNIISKSSGKPLAVEGDSRNNDAGVCQNANANSDLWTFEYAGNGYYYIINKNSGKALDVPGGNTNENTQPVQYDRNNNRNQQWNVIDLGKGMYRISPKCAPTMGLDVAGASNNDNAKVVQWPYKGSDNEVWYIKQPEAVDEGILEYTTEIANNTTYTLKNAKTNYALMPKNSRPGKVNTVLFDVTGSDSQKWCFVQNGDFYNIKNAGTDFNLHYGDGVRGAQVEQDGAKDRYENGEKYNWKLRKVTSGDFAGGYLIEADKKDDNGNPVYVTIDNNGRESEIHLQNLKARDLGSQVWYLDKKDNVTNTGVTKEKANEVGKAFLDKFYVDTQQSNGTTRKSIGGGFWVGAELIEMLLDGYETLGDDVYREAFDSSYQDELDNIGNRFWYWTDMTEEVWATNPCQQQGYDTNPYNDDVMWLVMASARAHMLFGSKDDGDGFRNYLKYAEDNFKVVYDRGLKEDGTIRWCMEEQAGTGTTSCINGPTVVAACYLGEITKDENYFNIAKDVHQAQINAGMYDPNEKGRVWDSPNNNWASCYNQGTWIGSCVLLYNHYHDQAYLDQAKEAMDFVTKKNGYFSDEYGVLKQESSIFGGDLPAFRSIMMRYMRMFIDNDEIKEKVDMTPYIEWFNNNARVIYNNKNASGLVYNPFDRATPNDLNFVVDGKSGDDKIPESERGINAAGMSGGVSLMLNLPKVILEKAPEEPAHEENNDPNADDQNQITNPTGDNENENQSETSEGNGNQSEEQEDDKSGTDPSGNQSEIGTTPSGDQDADKPVTDPSGNSDQSETGTTPSGDQKDSKPATDPSDNPDQSGTGTAPSGNQNETGTVPSDNPDQSGNGSSPSGSTNQENSGNDSTGNVGGETAPSGETKPQNNSGNNPSGTGNQGTNTPSGSTGQNGTDNQPSGSTGQNGIGNNTSGSTNQDVTGNTPSGSTNEAGNNTQGDTNSQNTGNNASDNTNQQGIGNNTQGGTTQGGNSTSTDTNQAGSNVTGNTNSQGTNDTQGGTSQNTGNLSGNTNQTGNNSSVDAVQQNVTGNQSGAITSQDVNINLDITQSQNVISSVNGTNNAATTEKINVGKVKIKKLAKKTFSKKITITLDQRLKKATGYVVYIYYDKDEAKDMGLPYVKKTIKKNNSKVLTVSNKKLKGETKLYVRVRPYLKANGKTYYGKYSAVKTCKSK